MVGTRWFVAIVLVGWVSAALAESGGPDRRLPAWIGGQPRTVHAAEAPPWLSVHDGHALPTRYIDAPEGFERALQEQRLVPTTLAQGDMDGDGLNDLIVGYAESGAGWLAIHVANLDARDPYGASARKHKRAGTFRDNPFRAEVTVIALPVVPEFLCTGDFDGNGRTDIVGARRHGTGLWWLRQTGNGVWAEPQRIPLPGAVTAFVAGEIHRRDGRNDLVVGIQTEDGARLLVYQDREGALTQPPQTVVVPHPIDALVVGPFGDGRPLDLAAAGRNALTVFSGSTSGTFDVASARGFTFRREIRGMTAGDFVTGIDRAAGLAVLLDDGDVEMLRFTGLNARASRERVARDGKTLGPTSPDGIVATDLSTFPAQDLLLRDTVNRRILIRSGGTTGPGWASLETSGPPVALLPMRLNGDAFDDLVVLIEGSASPSVLATIPAQLFLVDSIGDEADALPGDGVAATTGGACTLRAAIEEANASPAIDRIEFRIDGPGPHTIQPLTPLPAIFEPLEIDATTEPDYAGTPVVELDGSLAGEADGLGLMAPSCTVRGLVVNRFGLSGIVVVWREATGNRIQANFIGTDVTGTVAAPNRGNGISIINGAWRNVVGTDGDGVGDQAEGNLISGNADAGIGIHGDETDENVVAGNLVGTDVTGTSAVGNATYGMIVVFASLTIIGTDGNGVADDVEGNTVSASGNDGILVLTPGAEQNVIAGNYVGTDSTGAAALGNGGFGVAVIEARLNRVGTNGDGLSDAEERNVVSGNLVRGVLLGSATEANIVAGNFIGTDPTGTLAVPNVQGGLEIANGSRGNRIGTNADGQFDEAERNVISGNADSGIWIFGEPVVEDNVIAGNFIGTQADGTSPLGNGRHGIVIWDPSRNNTIGGVGVTPRQCDGPCNTIAYNGSGGSHDGIRLVGGTGNAILGNVFHSNHSGAAIDIDAGGVSPNDTGDPDTGANNLQNYPLLADALTVGNTTTIAGFLNSVPDSLFRLEIYANAACDPQGYGEGEMLLVAAEVTTDSMGQAGFSIPVSPAAPDDHWLSATATRLAPGGTPTDTSEFSPCLGIGPPVSAGTVPELTVDRGAGQALIFDWTESCIAEDMDYAIYQGTIGDYSNHWGRVCSTQSLTSVSIWTAADRAYFFVVPMSATREGSYGQDSDGFERPPGPYRCRPQQIGTCP